MPGQVYSVSTLGGNTTLPYLSQKLRSAAQPLFRGRQFVDAKEALGYGRGETFMFDKRSNIATQGGVLVETNTVPETNYTFSQGTAVISEYGNSVPYTNKLKSLSQFEIDAQTEAALRDDQVKVLESACMAQYAATDYIAVMVSTSSVAFTTNGTATATATADLTATNVRSVVDFMKKKLIPTYNGSEFICIASVQSLSGLHSDTGAGGWNDISKYTDSFAKNIFAGEVGNYYKTRFVDETGYLSNTIGNGASRGQAVFFGADAVYEVMAMPETIKVKNPMDYDRDLGLAWLAMLGFKIVWNHASDAEQHIVFVTSA